MGSFRYPIILVILAALSTLGCQNSGSSPTRGVFGEGSGDDQGFPDIIDQYENPTLDRVCLSDKGQTPGPSNSMPAIIGGRRLTKDGPIGRATVHIQMIQSSSNGRASFSACTGTLIGSNMIITAAHCFDGPPRSQLASRTRVIFATDPHDVCGGAREMRDVEMVAVHPDWDGGADKGNDLALIRIEGTAPADYEPMPVLNTFPSNLTMQDSYLAGYGKNIDDIQGKIATEISALKLAVVRAYGPFETLSPELRNHVSGMPYNNSNTYFLAFNTSRGEAMCQGDSGGPAAIKDNGMIKLIGVASFVRFPSKQPTCKQTAIYNSVSYYQQWLQQTYGVLMTALSTSNPFEIGGLTQVSTR